MTIILTIGDNETLKDFKEKVRSIEKQIKKVHKCKVTSTRMSGYNDANAKYVVKAWL